MSMASPFLILEVSCEERSSTQLPPSGIQNDCYCKVPTYSTAMLALRKHQAVSSHYTDHFSRQTECSIDRV